MHKGNVYLIPTVLHEDALQTIAPYIVEAIQQCAVFYVENDKTARRFFKKVWPQMVIDDYEWLVIHKAETQCIDAFERHLKAGKNVGIVSEAGCPGVADPGQVLVAVAQQLQAVVKPLVGPNSILLALMASGMNGQRFQFHGYLPIDSVERKKSIQSIEEYSIRQQCTQIFIETPYRNNQLLKDLLQVCKSSTQLCVAVDITATSESIVTKSIAVWKQSQPDIHKRLAIFLLAG